MNKENLKDIKRICNIFIDSNYYISIAIEKSKISKLFINNKGDDHGKRISL